MLKASTLQLAQAGQHGLGMVARPATPRPAQAMVNDGVGGAFDSPLSYISLAARKNAALRWLPDLVGAMAHA
jgi:hypothetical protein